MPLAVSRCVLRSCENSCISCGGSPLKFLLGESDCGGGSFAAAMKTRFAFKEQYTVEQRKFEASEIRKRHPERVPVIVARSPKSPVPDIDREKFLVPADITVAQFMWVIRKRIRVGADKAMFLLVDKNLPQSSVTMGELYSNWGDEDGFLYVTYSAESTFG